MMRINEEYEEIPGQIRDFQEYGVTASDGRICVDWGHITSVCDTYTEPPTSPKDTPTRFEVTADYYRLVIWGNPDLILHEDHDLVEDQTPDYEEEAIVLHNPSGAAISLYRPDGSLIHEYYVVDGVPSEHAVIYYDETETESGGEWANDYGFSHRVGRPATIRKEVDESAFGWYDDGFCYMMILKNHSNEEYTFGRDGDIVTAENMFRGMYEIDNGNICMTHTFDYEAFLSWVKKNDIGWIRGEHRIRPEAFRTTMDWIFFLTDFIPGDDTAGSYPSSYKHVLT